MGSSDCRHQDLAVQNLGRSVGELKHCPPNKKQGKRQSQPIFSTGIGLTPPPKITELKSKQDDFAPIGKVFSMIFEHRPFRLTLVPYEKKKPNRSDCG